MTDKLGFHLKGVGEEGGSEWNVLNKWMLRRTDEP
jgi:hypothetical protein